MATVTFNSASMAPASVGLLFGADRQLIPWTKNAAARSRRFKFEIPDHCIEIITFDLICARSAPLNAKSCVYEVGWEGRGQTLLKIPRGVAGLPPLDPPLTGDRLKFVQNKKWDEN